MSLIIIFLTLQASRSVINDKANLFDKKTITLVQTKNKSYKNTKANPQIILKSYDKQIDTNKLKPNNNDIFIVIIHGSKNNAQIIAGKNLQKVFNSNESGNIIKYSAEKLRSNNKENFNIGVRKTFNICATLIDQHYNYGIDKNTITQKELDKIQHPQRINLGLSLLIVIVGAAIFGWFQNWKTKM